MAVRMRRHAKAQWAGTIRQGSGAVSLASGAASDLLLSLDTRKADATTATSPEELLAAAHGACFAMSLRSVLDGEGVAATAGVGVDATCVLRVDGTAWTLEEMILMVSAEGLSREEIVAAAAAADARCPVSAALRPTVKITVTVAGESGP